MPEEHDTNMIISHSERLRAVEESTKSAHHRMDNLNEFKDVMYEMNANIRVITEQIKTMALTLVQHDTAIKNIEESMETKETVARLHGKIEEMEDMYANDKHEDSEKKLEEFEAFKKWAVKVLASAGLFVVAALVIFAVVILIGLARANGGNLPIPTT